MIERHPAILQRHLKTNDALIWKLTNVTPQFDRALIKTLHKITARVTVFPATYQGVIIEVTE